MDLRRVGEGVKQEGDGRMYHLVGSRDCLVHSSFE